MPFLTAHWKRLALVSYAVPPEVLQPHLPPGVEPDMRDGQAFASLVGFDFCDTRVLGVSWPGFRTFPEFNLRFYVRKDGRRGVTFYRELVPQRFVAWVARTLYNEPYHAVRIANVHEESAEAIEMTYRFAWDGRPQRLWVRGRKPPVLPAEDSTAHFFKEHRWGFGTTRWGGLLRYEVVHPRWRIYQVDDWQLDLDWTHVYGPEWAFLQDADPVSVVLAEGSPVAVHWRGMG